ncbi:MAG: hypothetical protein AAB437_01855 [Patescibacteria group bacterium]
MYTKYEGEVNKTRKQLYYREKPALTTMLIYLTILFPEIEKVLKTITPDCLLEQGNPVTVFIDQAASPTKPVNPTKIKSASCVICPHAQRIGGPKPENPCQIYYGNNN